MGVIMNRKERLLFQFLVCSILIAALCIVPSTAEENEEELAEQDPIKEEEKATTSAPPPPPPDDENKSETTPKPEKKPKPKGRNCYACAHCSTPTPENEVNCGNSKMDHCVKTEWEATGAIMRYCGKTSEMKFALEHGKECEKFVDGIKVCYCEDDLCNGSLSFLPKTLVLLTLLSFSGLVFIYSF
ncbi:unnamed protein product [Orchesella dallaii]|uniref:Protein quiver n=1 Tax=Orchesella dallaii TaxID=48710 RepID=A0ABP1RYF0_9HEXA